MARSILIVGSGPAAVGAALACAQDPDVRITVVDVGGALEPDHEEARARMEVTAPASWATADLERVRRAPEATARRGGLPEKRSHGSDFPFRDFGQRRGVYASEGVNEAVISGAYGGFSNVWGAQVMPFTPATFHRWPVPVGAAEMKPHYESVLRAIPFAAEHDDLEELFPLNAPAATLPALSERTQAVLTRYERHRSALNRRGVILGRARLAFKAADCVLCGLCMTGCPYSLIYSASQTMDHLRRAGQVRYHGGHIAVRVEEQGENATVTTKELASGRLQRFTADRLLLACGAIGTSRLVMTSLNLFDIDVPVLESRQFALPFLSRTATRHDPRDVPSFTLNQFNMIVKLDDEAYNVSQLHFYTYDPAFVEALPSFMRTPGASWIRTQLLRRLCVALGYLPSWASPQFSLQVRASREYDSLPSVALCAGESSFIGNRMLRATLRKIIASASDLDLWPVVPLLNVSAAGKSYHWGGTFPHTDSPASRFATDVLGRVAPWKRIHLVDASVFPSVPATTFTLSIMANAHRIGEAILREPA